MESDYKIPLGQVEPTSLNEAFQKGKEIEMAQNDSLTIKNRHGTNSVIIEMRNDKPKVTLDNENNKFVIDVDDGLRSTKYYQNIGENFYVQKKYVDFIQKPYQSIVSSGNFDVSQIENNDITVVFTDTTHTPGILTIPTANASNEGKVINLVAHSRGKTFSQPYTDSAGNLIPAHDDLATNSVRIMSIDGNWYEIK